MKEKYEEKVANDNKIFQAQEEYESSTAKRARYSINYICDLRKIMI